jgi:hypothetical protein
MVGFRPHLRRVRLPFGTLLLAVLVSVAVLAPFHHHDLVCHLQSPTHCTTCLTSSAAEDPADLDAVSRSPLVAIGLVAAGLDLSPDAALAGESSGRSPPRRG